MYTNTSEAAAAGNLQGLMSMMSLPDFAWHYETTAHAAVNGHLEVLKYVYENGCPWVVHTCSSAASGGHLDCLKFAHEHGAPLPDWTVNGACAGGHLECLKYACEHGCHVDEFHAYLVAQYSLECLQYLHSIRCPWNVFTTLYAAREYKLDCLRFALENGCPVELGVWVSLNQHSDKIDLDEHIWLRNQLFSMMESGVFIRRGDCQELYDKCHAKQEEIQLQKQFAFYECFELPQELIQFIICDYF